VGAGRLAGRELRVRVVERADDGRRQVRDAWSPSPVFAAPSRGAPPVAIIIGMPEAVLFDLDGVLLDSRTAIARCIEHALQVHGVPVPPAVELERFIGPPLLDAFAQLAGADRAESCLATYRERYVHSSLEETTVVP